MEFSIEDWAQLLYPAPCCMYDPEEIRVTYLVPYQQAITKVFAWSGEWTYRYWEMLFGYNGWVEVGQGWVDKWETDFEVSFSFNINFIILKIYFFLLVVRIFL